MSAMSIATTPLLISIYVIITVCLAVAAANVAAAKGRSVLGWFILSLIFPFAILFVSIAPSERRY